MNIKSIILIISLCAIMFMPFKTASADFGVIVNNGDSEGYTLFAPFRGTSAYLIDSEGHLINRWQDPDGYSGGGGMYLTERGTLIRGLLTGKEVSDGGLGAGGGIGGLIREYDWHGNVLWEYEYNSNTGIHHHDIELLPNGNILLVTYERVSLAECEAELLPRVGVNCDNDNGWFRTEKIIEIAPDYEAGGANIVWSWRMFDHLLKNTNVHGDRDEYPNLLDPSLPSQQGGPVGRTNSIDYNPELDQIAFSCNTCGELFIIDHNPELGEETGFLYRWGNPANYGASGDQELFGQHTVRWIKNEFGNNFSDPDGNRGQRKKAERNHVGNIIAFNNNYNGCVSGPCSSVTEITPPVDEVGNYPEDADDWDVDPDPAVNHFTDITDESGNRTFRSTFISSAQKLPNGRYLIDDGNRFPAGSSLTEFLEVEADGEVVWKYVQPVASCAPGNSPASRWPDGKPDDICMVADAAGLPNLSGCLDIFGDVLPPEGTLDNATQWPFRVERYAEDFKGFEGKDMKKGPLLTDVTPFPGVDYGPCPTVSHD
jgi:hypothetical protein